MRTMRETNANEARYEITFYTKAEDASPVRAAIEAHRGKVAEGKPFEKVRLEYPIKKESYAFMGVLRAELSPDAVKEVSRSLTLSSAVLRHLITASSLPEEGGETERRPVERKKPFAPRAAPAGNAILTNEALERKIEEILQ